MKSERTLAYALSTVVAWCQSLDNIVLCFFFELFASPFNPVCVPVSLSKEKTPTINKYDFLRFFSFALHTKQYVDRNELCTNCNSFRLRAKICLLFTQNRPYEFSGKLFEYHSIDLPFQCKCMLTAQTISSNLRVYKTKIKARARTKWNIY